MTPMFSAVYTPMFALFPLILVVMLLVAGLVAGVAMLSNERTRFVGGVILGLLGVLVVGGGGLVSLAFFYTHEQRPAPVHWQSEMQNRSRAVVSRGARQCAGRSDSRARRAASRHDASARREGRTIDTCRDRRRAARE